MRGFAFAALVGRIERRLVGELALEPLRLPPELAQLTGSFRGQPATLRARAYSGPRLGYVRFVDVRSPALDIGNVLALPLPEFSLPLLGVDLVEVGRDNAVVVADLTPMTDDPSARDGERAVLGGHQSSTLGAGFELPAWAREWFSSAALAVRVSPDQAPAAEAAVGAYVAAFAALVRAGRADPARGDLVARRQRAYASAHREHDRGLLLLRRIFEPALAERFLREVLFPEQVPT